MRLSFDLPAEVTLQCEEFPSLLPGWFPELRWGIPEDLLKHSDEWPDACLYLLQDNSGEFPVNLNLLRFPLNPRNFEQAAATLTCLMYRLASHLECRVRANAYGLGRSDSEGYHAREWLLCQGGRFYFKDKLNGTESGWRPLDDLPLAQLDTKGELINEQSICADFAEWRLDHSALLAEIDQFAPSADVPTEEDFTDDVLDFDFPPPSGSPGEEADPETVDIQSYLKKLDQWEDGYGTTSAKQLIAQGISLPDPETLTDTDLTAKLSEVISGLAKVNTYIDSTDHMTDRELYTRLWTDTLNQITIDLSDEANGSCASMIDFACGDEDDTIAHLRYSASIHERAEWKLDFPDDPIPAHEPNKPADRDRFLPKPSY